jgi:hypothetical protein
VSIWRLCSPAGEGGERRTPINVCGLWRKGQSSGVETPRISCALPCDPSHISLQHESLVDPCCRQTTCRTHTHQVDQSFLRKERTQPTSAGAFVAADRADELVSLMNFATISHGTGSISTRNYARHCRALCCIFCIV